MGIIFWLLCMSRLGFSDLAKPGSMFETDTKNGEHWNLVGTLASCDSSADTDLEMMII